MNEQPTAPFVFGSAYYDEYMPCDRLEEDMAMMVQAGFTTLRIAESTWSTEEPVPGQFDFSHVDRVIDAAARHGLNIIVGTPTYAVPHWLVQLDPDVLATTGQGKNKYGPRQNMDITNPTFRHYAGRIIEALVSHTAGRKNVIGYQIDNETKHYFTAGPAVLARFRQSMREKFGTVGHMNQALGFAYWSNSVTSFDDLPDPTGTINGSYGCEFARFQRQLAAEYLLWQSELVSRHKRDDQFITQNFDYQWRNPHSPDQMGYSWGVQPDINHFEAADAVTLTGTDIYFFPQDRFTGAEIAFGGDLMRPLKHSPYLVLESQAQAFPEWLPYPGQLRQMGWSHIASGACGVMYWHWHSIHNAIESYWKGLLSHDFQPNPTYNEACQLGGELKALSPLLSGMTKRNRIALVISNEALSALDWFPTDAGLAYNDVVHWIYDTLYRLNLECDVIFDRETDWSDYDLLCFPALYCANDALIGRIRDFVAQGGTVFSTFRSFMADESVKIYHDRQPHGLTEVFGMTYNQFTRPVNVTVNGQEAQHWMELLCPTTAEPISTYQHQYWGQYAAVTRNQFGNGTAWYLGTMLPEEGLHSYLLAAAQDAGIPVPAFRWPVICRSGRTSSGQPVHFLFHYSSHPATVSLPWSGIDLLTSKTDPLASQRVQQGDVIQLSDWGVSIVLEDT